MVLHIDGNGVNRGLAGGKLIFVNIKTARQASLAILCVVFLAFYIASKINFFTRYDALGVDGFIRQHGIYWMAMAATAFTIWLIERFWRDKP